MKYQVPYNASDRQYKQYKKEYLDILEQILINGRERDEYTIDLFEQRLALDQDRKFAISCNGNTDALLLAIKALDLPAGSDIIVSSYGPIYPATSILLAGHKPLFVDVKASGGINLDNIPHRLTDNTRAMLILDMFGFVIDRDSVKKASEVYNIPVIYDCSQSYGSKWNNLPSGSNGIMSCFSFEPMNFLSNFTGGSAVLCDEELMDFFLRGLRSSGKSINQPGHNNIMNAQTAALLTFNINYTVLRMLKNLDTFKMYNQYFKTFSSIYPISLLYPLGEIYNQSTTNYSTYVIQIEKRDKLKAFLESKGIETKIPFDSILPNQSMFGKQPNDFYVAEQLTKECLSLPIFPEMNPYELELVIKNIIDFFKN